MESLSSHKRQVVAPRYRAIYLVSVLLLILGFSSLAFGQEATIVGTVTDPSGSVIPNVTVTAVQTATGDYQAMGNKIASQREFVRVRELHEKADESVTAKMPGSPPTLNP